MLPLIIEVLTCEDMTDACPDCQGSGYTQDTRFDLCYCMDGPPAYDFPRLARGEVLTAGIARYIGPGDRTEIWELCPDCQIDPIMGGPPVPGVCKGVPWVPDCATCADTGWSLRHITAAARSWDKC